MHMDNFSVDASQLISRNSEKLAMELVFAEVGSDNGLLPINSLLAELEDLVSAGPSTLPAGFLAGLTSGRQLVDECLEAGTFQPNSLAALRAWVQWLQSIHDAITTVATIPLWIGVGPLSCSVGDGSLPSTPPSEPGESILLNLANDADLLKEFVSESMEHLQNIEAGVLILELNPKDSSTLASIFRAFHTFKGGSGFLNLAPINQLAHELESLLDLLRQEKLQVNVEIISLILDGGDVLKRFITAIDRQLCSNNAPEPIQFETSSLKARIRNSMACPGEEEFIFQGDGSERVNQQVKSNSGKALHQYASVKVPIEKLDSLVDLVGEMVIAQSLVAQDQQLKSIASSQLTRNLTQLSRITKELQKTAMSLRMVPVRTVFQKMNRVVRDVAAKTGKEVELILSGEETELDRTIVEEISDPLIHMIRNSVDHGIELPNARVATGKNKKGVIHLKAFHRGGNIIIQILDDGAGLCKKRIEEKAITSGLIKPDHNLPDKEIYSLIFAPGFSTAERVTDLSGRGVGMDVVRRNIDKMRGKIE
ncbi:MAG: CheA signal transduction histidine kinase, partial [Verrucomicrobiales bacterium]|nr:CheA signal transduction histidine kinase [Verrucomicrobiales bacterium]